MAINLALDLLAILTLAIGFVPIGDAIQGRLSASLFDANESFLIGSTLAAAILFPASLFLGRATLTTLVSLTLSMGVAWIFLMVRRRRSALPSKPGNNPLTLFGVLSVILIGAGFLFFCWRNLKMSPGSDGLGIWAWRAATLLRNGGLTGDAWPEYGYDSRFLAYPPLIPLLEAFVSYWGGGSVLPHLKVVFCLFYASLGLSLYSAARRITERRFALVFTSIVFILPGLASGTNVLGFADMPMAAVVAGVCVSALQPRIAPAGFRDPLPWLIAGLLTAKSEGNALFLIASAALVCFFLWTRRGPLTKAGQSSWQPAFIVLVSAQALSIAYSHWIGTKDPTYGPVDSVHLLRAAFLWADIPSAAAPYLLDLHRWGLLWIAFIPSALIVFRRGATVYRALAVATAAALSAYTAVFYFTNWDFQTQLQTAYPRLLEHIAPAAAVVVLIAWTIVCASPSTEEHL